MTHGRTEFYSPHAFHDFDSEEASRVSRSSGWPRRAANRVILVMGSEATNNYHTHRHHLSQARPPSPASKLEQREREAEAGEHTGAELRAASAEHLAKRPDRPDGIMCDSEIARASACIAGPQGRGPPRAPGHPLHLQADLGRAARPLPQRSTPSRKTCSQPAPNSPACCSGASRANPPTSCKPAELHYPLEEPTQPRHSLAQAGVRPAALYTIG